MNSFVKLSYDNCDFLILEKYVTSCILLNENLNHSDTNGFVVNFDNHIVPCFDFTKFLNQFVLEIEKSSNKENLIENFYNVLILDTKFFNFLPEFYKSKKYFGLIVSSSPIVEDYELSSFSVFSSLIESFLFSKGIYALRFLSNDKVQYFINLDKLLQNQWNINYD